MWYGILWFYVVILNIRYFLKTFYMMGEYVEIIYRFINFMNYLAETLYVKKVMLQNYICDILDK